VEDDREDIRASIFIRSGQVNITEGRKSRE